MTLVLPLLLLGGCEVALRLAGFGEAYELVERATDSSGNLAWRLNPAIDHVYFGSRDMQGPEPRHFALPKPVGTFRVVFLGESTVIGFPYPPEVSFPRQVELLLEAQRPGVDVEVLNAGITAINSFEIADLAARCDQCAADLVVIHAGHNEFFGPGGPGSTVLPLPPGLIQWTFRARRTRLGQVIERLLPAEEADGRHPLEAFPRLTEIRLSDPEYAAAVENYRQQLTTAVEALRADGIPVLLSTVSSNLRDQGPIRNVWPRAMDAAQVPEAERTIGAALELHLAGDSRAALDELLSMEPACRESALWQYRRGQLHAALGEEAAAREAFELARDYDGCRFRAPGEFQEIVADIARDAGKPGGVFFLDIADAVARASPGGVAGRELYLEHVHYNLRGHRLLAREFARCIQTEILKDAWEPAREPDEGRLDALIGLIPEDELAGLSFALEAVQTRPLADAVDGARVETDLEDAIARGFASLPTPRREWFANLSLREMQRDLVSGLARQAAASGDGAACLELARIGALRRPWSYESQSLLLRARGMRAEREP